jgi:hypothetical protein
VTAPEDATAHDARVESILAWYAAATPEARRRGRQWYADARSTAQGMAVAYGVPLRTAAGVVSALSPRTQWSVNVRWAHAILAAYADGADMPRVSTAAFRRKSWAIAHRADYLDMMSPTTAPKTREFASAILGDTSAVVVDVWAARAAGESPTGLQGRRYAAIADAYRGAARRLRMRPAILQAIVWCAIRGAAD